MTDIHNGKFHFFWSGPFSNWQKSFFKMRNNRVLDKNYGPLIFNSGEQFMMFTKAALFGDVETADKILDAESPKQQKALGREVKNFNVEVWEANARRLLYPGWYEKYNQNRALLIELLSHGDKIFVEASPYDTIWGIGLDEVAAAVTPEDQWRGRNWLGEITTEIRNRIRYNDLTNPYE